METIKCPNCGASFQSDGVNNVCPYCGSTIKSNTPKSTQKKQDEESPSILPFVLSEDDAISTIIKELVVTNGVPLNVFEQLSNIKVEKYRLPMYGSLINLDVCWSAQSVVRKTRKYRDKNGNEKTEYYDEYYPISGNAFGRCDTLFLANKCAEIPGKLRNYAERLPYTTEYSKYIDSELSETKMEGESKDIQADIRFEELRDDRETDKYFADESFSIAHGQISGSYVDLQTTWKANFSDIKLMMIGFYYITFEYDGVEYYGCVNAVTGKRYVSVPRNKQGAEQEHNEANIFTSKVWMYGILTFIFLAVTMIPFWSGKIESYFGFIFIPTTLIAFLYVVIKGCLISERYKKQTKIALNMEEALRHESAESIFPQYCSKLNQTSSESAEKSEELAQMKAQTSKQVKSLKLWLIISFVVMLVSLLLAFTNGGKIHDIGQSLSSIFQKAPQQFSDSIMPYSEQLVNGAEDGEANAQLNLGRCYYFGNGVSKDYEKAFDWTKKAAEQGHYVAQYNLANMYFNGWGTTKSMASANEWMKKASDAGYAPAQYAYGIALINGEGIPKNENEGVALIKSSAEKGLLDGRAMMGHFLLNGVYLGRDIETGLSYTKSAANENHPLALYDLSICYLNGIGVTADRNKGKEYLNKSAALDYQPAKDELEKLKQSEAPTLVGKTYIGFGNSSGLGCDMEINFESDGVCTCISDWYRAYPSAITTTGNYIVKDNKVTVRCNGETLIFIISDNGNILSFDNSNAESMGTASNDYMTLHLQNEMKVAE